MLNQNTKEIYSSRPFRRHFLPEARTRIALLAAFAAVYLIWGSTFLAIRFAVESIPPFLMAGVRFLTAGAALYVWARRRGAPRPERAHLRTAFITGGLMLLGGIGILGWAEQYVSSGLAALLVAAVPMWAVVIDAASKRKWPSGTVIAGVGLGLVGVALLIGPANIAAGDSHSLFAMLLILAGTFSWSLGAHYSRRAEQPASQNLATGLNLLAGGFLLLLFSGARGEYASFAPAAITLKSALAVGYLILFGSIVGFSAYMWLVKVTTPARASSNFYVNPLVAVFLGWLLAGEPISPLTLVAAAVIVGAVALIVSQKR